MLKRFRKVPACVPSCFTFYWCRISRYKGGYIPSRLHKPCKYLVSTRWYEIQKVPFRNPRATFLDIATETRQQHFTLIHQSKLAHSNSLAEQCEFARKHTHNWILHWSADQIKSVAFRLNFPTLTNQDCDCDMNISRAVRLRQFHASAYRLN